MERRNDESQEEQDEFNQSPSSDIDEESNELAELIGEEEARLIPPAARRVIAQRLITRFTSIGIAPTNPVHRHITSEHISTMLTHLDRDRERERTSQSADRKYQFLYFIIGLSAIIGLIIFFALRNDTSLLTTILISIATFLGGYGVGFRRIWRRREVGLGLLQYTCANHNLPHTQQSNIPRREHRVYRRFLAGPHLKGSRSLIYQHRHTAQGSCACAASGSKKNRVLRIINHVHH